MTPMIETPRLRLRPPGLGDAARLAEQLNNLNVSRFLNPVPHPYSETAARDWISTCAPNTPLSAHFAIELPGTGLIGAVAIDGELGYWLAEPFWGSGYATEAVTALLDWHFADTAIEKLESSAHLDNHASRAVQRKLGFIESGRMLRYCLAQHCEVEHVTTELTKDNFARRTPT